MKKDFLFPILALSLICLVMAAALALVNNVTHPIIEEAAYNRAVEAMREIIPQADEFVTIQSGAMPAAVVSAYRAANGTGYIFIVSTRGFGGEMRIMTGICNNGNFIGSSVLAHNETISFANRVFAVRDDYEGRGLSLLEADVITGATRSFKAYQYAIRYAHEAFEALRGSGQ